MINGEGDLYAPEDKIPNNHPNILPPSGVTIVPENGVHNTNDLLATARMLDPKDQVQAIKIVDNTLVDRYHSVIRTHLKEQGHDVPAQTLIFLGIVSLFAESEGLVRGTSMTLKQEQAHHDQLNNQLKGGKKRMEAERWSSRKQVLSEQEETAEALYLTASHLVLQQYFMTPGGIKQLQSDLGWLRRMDQSSQTGTLLNTGMRMVSACTDLLINHEEMVDPRIVAYRDEPRSLCDPADPIILAQIAGTAFKLPLFRGEEVITDCANALLDYYLQNVDAINLLGNSTPLSGYITDLFVATAKIGGERQIRGVTNWFLQRFPGINTIHINNLGARNLKELEARNRKEPIGTARLQREFAMEAVKGLFEMDLVWQMNTAVTRPDAMQLYRDAYVRTEPYIYGQSIERLAMLSRLFYRLTGLDERYGTLGIFHSDASYPILPLIKGMQKEQEALLRIVGSGHKLGEMVDPVFGVVADLSDRYDDPTENLINTLSKEKYLQVLFKQVARETIPLEAVENQILSRLRSVHSHSYTPETVRNLSAAFQLMLMFLHSESNPQAVQEQERLAAELRSKVRGNNWFLRNSGDGFRADANPELAQYGINSLVLYPDAVLEEATRIIIHTRQWGEIDMVMDQDGTFYLDPERQVPFILPRWVASQVSLLVTDHLNFITSGAEPHPEGKGDRVIGEPAGERGQIERRAHFYALPLGWKPNTIHAREALIRFGKDVWQKTDYWRQTGKIAPEQFANWREGSKYENGEVMFHTFSTIHRQGQIEVNTKPPMHGEADRS